MHKKLERDLMSLAHSILKMKKKDDVFALKEKAKDVYEKLSMLAFVEEYINTTPNLKETKEALLHKVVEAFQAKETIIEPEIISDKKVEPEKEIADTSIIATIEENSNTQEQEDAKIVEILEQPFDELEALMFVENDTATNFKNDVKDVGDRKTITLDEELKDTISVDIMADLFENAQPKSLNDKLASNIQIGLNDRIAFVKNLFDGKQEDYNRVVSQLNTFKSEKEAKYFVNTIVKPEYKWEAHEALEVRFLEIIERKFA